MANTNRRKIAVLAVGELLIDMISTEFAAHFNEVSTYKRLLGGSPANMSMNMARLGNRAVLVASVGNDGLGDFLKGKVEALGIDTTYIRGVDLPTTIILVTRSKEVSSFEAYRLADKEIIEWQFPVADFEELSIYHTTCFALSKEPAQSVIMKMAAKAADKGVQLSIDANYAKKIWPEQEQAQQLVAQYCKHGAIIKMSEVDWERLYNAPLTDAGEAAQFLLSLGAREACITLGSEGCYAANAREAHFLPARKVEVKDTTGAGDAFWSGYLTAFLDGHSLLERAMAGRKMAELKLGHFGPLPNEVDKSLLYEDFS
jgi:sugar/nucleoside kinase (ribokinase family)